jgi:hypothetical protein
MLVSFLKTGTVDLYSDFDMPDIATALLSEEVFSLSVKVNQNCTNLGLILVQTTSGGRFQYPMEISPQSAVQNLLNFNSANEPDSGLAIKSEYTDSNAVAHVQDWVTFTKDAGSTHSNRIPIVPPNVAIPDGTVIALSLKFTASNIISVNKRLFVGLEAAADIN